MKETFRKAWDCFLQHPSLALPVLLAAILSRSLTLLEHPVAHRLLLWGMQTHSVLGPVITSSTAKPWLYVLMFLIRFLLIYAAAIAGTLGTLGTACLAYRWLALKPGEAQPKVFWSRSIGGVLKFSLLALLLGGLVGAALIFTYLHVRPAHDYSSIAWQYIGYLQLLLSGLATAYLMTPYFLRVIHMALSHSYVQPESEHKARNAAILIAVAATALTLAMTPIILKLPRSEAATLTTAYLRSAIEALPQVFLAIVFALLLANNDHPHPAAPPTP